jgi:hypothetical protein
MFSFLKIEQLKREYYLIAKEIHGHHFVSEEVEQFIRRFKSQNPWRFKVNAAK